MLHALEAAAQRHESACGTGRMVWRVWNAGGGTPRAPVTLEKVRDKQGEVPRGGDPRRRPLGGL